MEVVMIKSRGYNYTYDKYELCVMVRDNSAYSGYAYRIRLYDTMEEMYSVKPGDKID